MKMLKKYSHFCRSLSSEISWWDANYMPMLFIHLRHVLISESIFTQTQLIEESDCKPALSEELHQTTSYALAGLARHDAVVWLVIAWTLYWMDGDLFLCTYKQVIKSYISEGTSTWRSNCQFSFEKYILTVEWVHGMLDQLIPLCPATSLTNSYYWTKWYNHGWISCQVW